MKSLKIFLGPKTFWFSLLLTVATGLGCVNGRQKISPKLFNGTDLTGWEITDFAGSGEIKVKDGELQIAMGELISGINLSHDNIPRTNYEL